jgi:hypothetical protein
LRAAPLLRHPVDRDGSRRGESPGPDPPQRARNPVRGAESHRGDGQGPPAAVRALPERLLRQVFGPALLPRPQARSVDHAHRSRQRAAGQSRTPQVERASGQAGRPLLHFYFGRASVGQPKSPRPNSHSTALASFARVSLSLFLFLFSFFWGRCRSCGSSSRTWATPHRRLWCKW